MRCALLFALCFAFVSRSAFLCAVLCLLPLSCALVASCCPTWCSVVVHCAVCVALCCFFPRIWVLPSAMPSPWVFSGAVGYRAVWCVTWLCCPLLCALCCVCFAVVLWCVFFFVAVRCAAGALVVSCWVRCVLRAFSKTEKLFPAGVLPYVPCPPCMQQYHTVKTPACFIYIILRLGLVCTPGPLLQLVGRALGDFETVRLQRKGGANATGMGQ